MNSSTHFQVTILPAKEKTCLYVNLNYENSLNFSLNQMFSYEEAMKMGIRYQHLHIVSDDKIKRNDWYITKLGHVFQNKHNHLDLTSYKKVIASTDLYLCNPKKTFLNIFKRKSVSDLSLFFVNDCVDRINILNEKSERKDNEVYCLTID